MEKREPAYTVGGNVNWNIHCGEHYGTKLKIELPFEHAQWCLTTRLLCPWDSPGKITGVGCHSLLQGIFPTQGSSLHFLCLLQAGGFFTTESLGKPQTTIWRSNSTTGSIPWENHNTKRYIHTYTSMFIALLFTIARTWKQPSCPSTDEWIKKMWYMYTMEYYWAIKRNKPGSFVEMWMDLETVIQGEISQKKKTNIMC